MISGINHLTFSVSDLPRSLAFYCGVLQLRLPPQPGPLWFRVEQHCEGGAVDWAEVPASGTDTRGLKHPAALLNARPPASAAAHQH